MSKNTTNTISYINKAPTGFEKEITLNHKEKDVFQSYQNDTFSAFLNEVGNYVTITYEKEKGALIYADKNIVDNIVKYYNQDIAPRIKYLIDLVNKSSFAMYAKYHPDRKEKLLFYDFYFNENWMRNEDLVQIFSSLDIPTQKVIFSAKPPKSFKNIISNFIFTDEVESILIKSDYELGGHRDNDIMKACLVNPKFITNKNSKPLQKEEYKKEVMAFTSFIVNDISVNRWKNIIKNKKIDFSRKNKNAIMPIIMNDFMNKYSKEVDVFAKENSLRKKDAAKVIRKHASSYIVKRIFS